MPIYEYRCSSCGHQQEFMQKLSDPTLTVCTQCNQPTFLKMLTAAGFQLKGSGWYATDFKNQGSAPAKPAESRDGGEKKADGGGEKTADSGGEKKSADSGEKKSGDSGEKKSGDSGEKKSADSGEKKSGDSGEKKSGDGAHAANL